MYPIALTGQIPAYYFAFILVVALVIERIIYVVIDIFWKVSR